MNEKVLDRINNGNEWYVYEQLLSLNNPRQTRVIRNRWKFFDKILEYKYKECGGRKLKLLDAGCGDGINLTYFTSKDFLEVHACDYNPLRVERVREKFAGLQVSQQDLTKLDLPSDNFDVILCSQVLEHIPEDEKAIENLKKYLAPNGILILGVPNEGCFFARLRNNVLEPRIARETDHVNFYTYDKFLGKVGNAGLCLQECFFEGFFCPHHRINDIMGRFGIGYALLEFLRKIIPSQSAGFYMVARGKS
ncbi:MAG: hypothetical protein A2020_13850 [Lentisphaerae bacterium GWF2_45_14]|nr:MAG: hypothetical protein A2020_13850 [Lentisphaerae bacterium GWF2_45_14]